MVYGICLNNIVPMQTVDHIVLGNQLLSSGQHPICVAGIRDRPDREKMLLPAQMKLVYFADSNCIRVLTASISVGTAVRDTATYCSSESGLRVRALSRRDPAP